MSKPQTPTPSAATPQPPRKTAARLLLTDSPPIVLSLALVTELLALLNDLRARQNPPLPPITLQTITTAARTKLTAD